MSRFSFTGRLVQGSAHKAGEQRKDKTTGALKFRKDGTPDCPFYMAVAIAKNPAQRFTVQGTPDFDSQKSLIDADARAAWPQFFNKQRPQGLHFPNPSLPTDCVNPKFANKIMDGDGFDEEGNPNSAKEGWAGCWVVKVSNGFAPKCYEWGANGWEELTPHSQRKIKCGDYVTVSGDCQSNKSDQSPGMYMNCDTVSFEQEGAEIQQAKQVDPNQALGSRGPNAASGHQQGNAGAGQTGGNAAGNQTSGTASDQQPYSGYRETASEAAPPPPGDDAPAPPSGPQMTAAATTSYEKYIAAGWTDKQLRDRGLMV